MVSKRSLVIKSCTKICLFPATFHVSAPSASSVVQQNSLCPLCLCGVIQPRDHPLTPSPPIPATVGQCRRSVSTRPTRPTLPSSHDRHITSPNPSRPPNQITPHSPSVSIPCLYPRVNHGRFPGSFRASSGPIRCAIAFLGALNGNGMGSL